MRAVVSQLPAPIDTAPVLRARRRPCPLSPPLPFLYRSMQFAPSFFLQLPPSFGVHATGADPSRSRSQQKRAPRATKGPGVRGAADSSSLPDATDATERAARAILKRPIHMNLQIANTSHSRFQNFQPHAPAAASVDCVGRRHGAHIIRLRAGVLHRARASAWLEV